MELGRSIPAAPGLPRALADSAGVAEALDGPRAGAERVSGGPGVGQRDVRDRPGRGVRRGKLHQVPGAHVGVLEGVLGNVYSALGRLCMRLLQKYV